MMGVPFRFEHFTYILGVPFVLKRFKTLRAVQVSQGADSMMLRNSKNEGTLKKGERGRKRGQEKR